ncbi:protein of unknown function DUF169 [Chloroherpeton thalassium ATCC 35110]|uniref:DUF169 domain-containing protein n=2 Tax=Chloroherpeton thalassium TaxID=100716 RepID=B3QZ58_CHLT3|nr:protein of unknown function DUF169 [Chloroherpeton thalassium ATCC 35110]
MTPKELSDSLCQIESLERKPVAITFIQRLADIPEGVKRFGSDAPEGEAKSMLCAMWGDAFYGAGPFYTVKSQQLCGGGAMGAGFGSTMPIEMAEKFMIGDNKIFGTMDALKNALKATLPFEDGEFEAQLISPLEKMNDDALSPDLVFIICKPAQGQRILRAYGFDTGELIRGVAGSSTCEMISSFVYKTNEPTFTLGDVGGNAGLPLNDDEVLVVFPYRKLEQAVKNLNRICRVSSMYKHTLYHEKGES